MTITATLVIVLLTALVSWRAFGDRTLHDRLILWPPAIERRKQYDRLLTHGFIHADWMHLIFNMVTLYSFGGAVEREGDVARSAEHLARIVRHRLDRLHRAQPLLGQSVSVAADVLDREDRVAMRHEILRLPGMGVAVATSAVRDHDHRTRAARAR